MTVTTTTPVTPAAATTTTTGSTGALGSLSGNFNNFLTLLMTQLKNQDPTAPMDTNAFTQQLVQYSTVEQQINTNSNLKSLIQATQSNTILQSSSLVGKQVDVTSDHVALQGGAALAHFTATSAEPVNITVTSDDGTRLVQTTMQAKAGSNDWSWDGLDTNGNQVADGSYKIAVNEPSGAALATTVTGRVTAMSRTASGVSVALGSLSTDVNNVQTVASN